MKLLVWKKSENDKHWQICGPNEELNNQNRIKRAPQKCKTNHLRAFAALCAFSFP
jgi:hypothetical protein